MRYKVIILTILSLAFVVSALAAESLDSCRSSAGGYCVNLAAAAQTQTAGALDFLGNPDTIGVLVANLYYWGLGLVAVAAFIMMVIGGFTYMTAGDNPGRVKEGTDYMKNAIFGLVLALISWLILYTINPDLVKSLDLAIPEIELKGGLGEPKYKEGDAHYVCNDPDRANYTTHALCVVGCSPNTCSFVPATN